MRRKKGIVLPKALMIMALLFVLAVSGLTLARLGFETQSAEISFIRARNAAETGLTEAVNLVAAHGSCSFSTDNRLLQDGSRYSFRMTNDTAQRICFIWSEGRYGNAKVVVTSHISFSVAEYGAMDIRTNSTISLGGSSSIANCDPRCPGPALIYGGSLNYTGITSTQCQNNNRGIVGNPAIISSDTSDRVGRYFCTYISGVCDENHPCNSDPQNNKASNEAELFNNVYQRYASKLRIGGMDTLLNNGSFADFSVISNNLSVNLPTHCKSTDSSFSCSSNGTHITCKKGNDEIVINLATCGEVYVASDLTLRGRTLPSGVKIFVNGKLETSADTNLRDSTIITRGSVNLTNQITGGNIVSKSNVNITDSLVNTNLFTEGGVSFDPKTGGEGVTGGFIYARGNLAIDGKGNFFIGTQGNCDRSSNSSDPNAKPVLMLVRGNISITGQGTTTINGFLFSWGTQMSISGNFNINGGFVVNNDQNFSLINNTGNAAINFNYCIYETLRRYYFCGLLKPVRCTGGTTPYPSMLRTRVIQY